jgi:hypothetical protein
MRAQMNQADAGDDLMRPALKFRQHLFRFIKITRLAKNFLPEKNQRVRAKHECIGNVFCDGTRLAMRIELAEFQRRQLPVENFRRIAGDDFEFQLQLSQQFRAARRSGGENEMLYFHMANHPANLSTDRKPVEQRTNLKRALWPDFS